MKDINNLIESVLEGNSPRSVVEGVLGEGLKKDVISSMKKLGIKMKKGEPILGGEEKELTFELRDKDQKKSLVARLKAAGYEKSKPLQGGTKFTKKVGDKQVEVWMPRGKADSGSVFYTTQGK